MRILFVCLGNICRSPTAEALFGDLLRAEGLDGVVQVDSAGTGGHFAGRPPAPEAIRAARSSGIELGGHRARAVTRSDYSDFDLLVAMDRANLEDLRTRAPAEARAEIGLLLDYAPGGEGTDVPDPYMGEATFEETLDRIAAGCRGLLAELYRKGVL